MTFVIAFSSIKTVFRVFFLLLHRLKQLQNMIEIKYTSAILHKASQRAVSMFVRVVALRY